MDKYLESLVKKGEAKEETVAEVAEEEVVEEIAEVVQTPEPAEEVKEEPKEERVAEVKIEKKPEPKKEQLKKDFVVPDKGDTVSVIDIRVFNTPDPKGPFKILSGNVIIGDRVADMTCIEYMKPAFGLVKGFTPDLK